ncbi:MAG: ATP-dependent helicase HrpB [Myxococcota bacterium]
MAIRLPVDDVLDEVRAAVHSHRGAVVTAPPGSGKTTRVPPALLDVVKGQVWVLQPRRVAARLTAQRIAFERGVKPGTEVGWRVRFDNKTSRDTRLVVVTEGLLTRRMQQDPFLEGIDAIVVDEVHERSLTIDLALALLADVRRDARPDLIVVAMSATVDAQPLADFFDVPVIHAEGRAFPIETVYAGERSYGPLSAQAAQAVRTHHQDGSTLVFLPGKRAIRDTADRLAGFGSPVFQLHGSLSLNEQQRALSPSDEPRVVLTTNIAETSVTVPGVRTVIDSGLVKTMRFDPALGIERLITERVSHASAEQRAGRAGRTGPGIAVRLWNSSERLLPFTTPALHREDLADLLLQVWAWGAQPRQFRWFEEPSPSHMMVAEALLERLHAVEDGRLTALGQTLSQLPISPRLGAMLVAGHKRGVLTDAAGAATLASEPDAWPGGVPGAADADDIRARLPRLRSHRRLSQVRDQLVRVAQSALGPCPDRPSTAKELVQCTLAGFPDRLGRRTAANRYRMPFGGAVLSEGSVIEDAPLIVALSVRGAQRGERAEHSIDLASPVEPDWLATEQRTRIVFDPADQAIVRRYETVFGDIVLAVRSEPAHDPELLAKHARVEHIQRSDTAVSLLARVNLLAAALPELEASILSWEDLLPALCDGIRRVADVRKANAAQAIRQSLDWRVRQALDIDAPTHVQLPSGSRKAITYTEDGPILAVRIQQIFGWIQTPRIARGRVPLTLHLMSPANRPVQITEDLASFWNTTWPEIRKEMRGRYPKHPWPEDPLTAPAQDRPNRRHRS